MQRALLALVFLSMFGVAGCTGKPDNIEPVKSFDGARYLGKWYEIARMDHSFEQGLSRVTADYGTRSDGGISVVNRGYDEKKNEWKQSEGRAYYVEKPDTGYLKVSFFGPFYGSYVIFDLDPQYRTSMVGGPDKSYLWLLARSPTIDAATKQRLVDKAQALGYDTKKLIWVDQSPTPVPLAVVLPRQRNLTFQN